MTARWEYLIVALPELSPPSSAPGSSAAVDALNREGHEGWEAIGMTVLSDGIVAVCLKRRTDAETGTEALAAT